MDPTLCMGRRTRSKCTEYKTAVAGGHLHQERVGEVCQRGQNVRQRSQEVTGLEKYVKVYIMEDRGHRGHLHHERVREVSQSVHNGRQGSQRVARM